MVQKSKSQVVRTAARLVPFTASLAALALVAACARTNPGKTKITSESEEAKVARAMKTYQIPDGSFADPKNIELAAKLLGASVDVKGDISAKGLPVEVSVSMKVGDDLISDGLIGSTKTTVLTDKAPKADAKDGLRTSALCLDDGCATIRVQLDEWKLQDVPTTATAADAVNPEATSEVAAAASAPLQVPTGANVVFVVNKKDVPVDAKDESKGTKSVYVLVMSTPSKTGATNGSLLSYEDAAKQKSGAIDKPATDVAIPADDAAKIDAAKPADTVAKPADTAAKPADTAAKPADTAAKPATAPAKPATAAAKPTDNTTSQTHEAAHVTTATTPAKTTVAKPGSETKTVATAAKPK